MVTGNSDSENNVMEQVSEEESAEAQKESAEAQKVSAETQKESSETQTVSAEAQKVSKEEAKDVSSSETEMENDFSAQDDIFTQYVESLGTIAPGSLVEGQIIKIDGTDIFVDIGYKTEGRLDLGEFRGETVKVGDPVDVMVVNMEDRNGNLVLSKKKADLKRAWDLLFDAFRNSKYVQAKVIERIKGGLRAKFRGLSCFIPASQISRRREGNLDKYIEKELTFKVIELDKRRDNIVISRRAYLEEEYQKRLDSIFYELQEGEVREGVVRRITDFGAFVDIGGIDGLLHITDISWAHIGHPSEVLREGQKIDVVILTADRESEKISLGLKQKSNDPWTVADNKYPLGAVVHGKVKKIMNYGAFIELEEGVEGLLHISDMTWGGRLGTPRDMLEESDEVDVRVLKIDGEERKLSLGMKQTRPDPWRVVDKNYEVGSLVKGKVKNIVSYGAFIELEEGLEGLLHISDMSWTSRIKHPSQCITEGCAVEVKILDIDQENKRISLGLKQVYPDPWTTIDEKYRIAQIYHGKVKNVVTFGAFVELEEDVEGLVHISDMSWSGKVGHPSEVVSPGQAVEVKVLSVNKGEKKISLGIKQLSPDPWDTVDERYTEGTVYTGVVQNITGFGAFIELEAGIEGLVHVSDMSWEKPVTDPTKVLKPGEDIKVCVLDINKEDKRISLGIKQVSGDPWKEVKDHLFPGAVVLGQVVRITGFGAFIRVARGIEGLVHISQLSDEHVEHVEDVLSVGDEVKVKVLEFNPDDHRLRLSVREGAGADLTEDMVVPQAPTDGRTMIGDVIGESLMERFQQLKKDEAEKAQGDDAVPAAEEPVAVDEAVPEVAPKDAPEAEDVHGIEAESKQADEVQAEVVDAADDSEKE